MKRIRICAAALLLSSSLVHSKPTEPLCILETSPSVSRLVLPDGSSVTRRHPDHISAFACTKRGAVLVDTHGVYAYSLRSDPTHRFAGLGVHPKSDVLNAGSLDKDSVWFLTGDGTVGLAYLGETDRPVIITSPVRLAQSARHTLADNDGPVTLVCHSQTCSLESSITVTIQ